MILLVISSQDSKLTANFGQESFMTWHDRDPEVLDRSNWRPGALRGMNDGPCIGASQ
jgi:hypothetical protein